MFRKFIFSIFSDLRAKEANTNCKSIIVNKATVPSAILIFFKIIEDKVEPRVTATTVSNAFNFAKVRLPHIHIKINHVKQDTIAHIKTCNKLSRLL